MSLPQPCEARGTLYPSRNAAARALYDLGLGPAQIHAEIGGSIKSINSAIYNAKRDRYTITLARSQTAALAALAKERGVTLGVLSAQLLRILGTEPTLARNLLEEQE